MAPMTWQIQSTPSFNIASKNVVQKGVITKPNKKITNLWLKAFEEIWLDKIQIKTVLINE